MSLNKKIKNVKQVKFGKILFRSKLEKFTSDLLEENDIPFDYEKHKFQLFKGFYYKGVRYERFKKKGKFVYDKKYNKIRDITYTPDFVFFNEKNPKTGFIIEVKGFRTGTFDIKWKLFLKYLNENNYRVDIFVPRNQTQVKETISLIKSQFKNDKYNVRKQKL